MEFWLAGILLILCIAGIVGITLHMRKKNKKVLGIVLLALCGLALCGYLIMGGILLYTIRQQPSTGEIDAKSDSAEITTMLRDAVKAMQMAGVMNGKNGNKFDPTGTYTVQKGDSFWLIASKVGCTMVELEQLNNKSRYPQIKGADCFYTTSSLLSLIYVLYFKLSTLQTLLQLD